MGAHLLGGFHLAVALYHRNHVTTNGASDLYKHQPDRPATKDRDCVADFHPGLVQPSQDASQRLGHRGIFETHIRRNYQHVGVNDPPRHADIFRIRSVVEQEIFAKIFLVFRAIEAHLARRGVQRHHPHAFFEAANTMSDFFDYSRQFVSEQSRRDDHARVVSVTQVKATCTFTSTAPSPTLGIGTFSMFTSSLPYRTVAVIFPFTAGFLPGYCQPTNCWAES